MELYQLSFENVVCLIGNNCSTNKSLAGMMERPLLGCSSHRLNLAVKKYIQANIEEEVDLVGKLMGKLSTLKQSRRLRLQTPSRPVKRNDTRWLGVIQMLERYDRLKTHIDTKDRELAPFVPSPIREIAMDDCKKDLVDLRSVTTELQSQTRTLRDTHNMFQSLITSYPDFNFDQYIGENANIVNAPDFEKGVIKIQAKVESQLPVQERKAGASLKNSTALPAAASQKDSGLSYAERALKQQKMDSDAAAEYIDTTFLLPTSNDVERLFSLASRLYTPHRRCMQPRTLEALVFLNRNRDLWDEALVAQIVHEKYMEDDVVICDDTIDEDDDEWEELIALSF